MKIFSSLALLFLLNTQLLAQLDSAQLLTDLQILSADSLEGRETGTKGSEIARKYISHRLSQIGIVAFFPEYRQGFEFAADKEGKNKVQGVNLAGIIKGNSDQVIVLSAHYDHIGVIGGKIFNGADDNASGVAALLALAEYFQANTPQHTIIFAFFDAEEKGIKGSDAFVSSVVFEKDKVLLNINMDMVSRSSQGEIYVAGTSYSPKLKKLTTKILPSQPIKVLLGHDGANKKEQNWTNSSDHKHFHKMGIPFLYFGVEDHPYYHKENDEFDSIDPTFYLKATQTVLNYAVFLDAQLAQTSLK